MNADAYYDIRVGKTVVLKAIDLHYTGGMRLPLARYLDISAPWQPYRTVATWYLWRSLDPVPVEY